VADDSLRRPLKSVHTVTLSTHPLSNWQTFSGTIRSRHEIPIAFQVSGRIQERHADAGDSVSVGDVLFKLDANELEQGLVAAKALVSSVEAELDLAATDLTRYRDLYEKKSINKQVLDRAELAERSAKARLKTAIAQLRQSEIALQHSVIRATVPGILVDVSGNVGQVVAIGESVALLADAREWEVEVFLPDGLPPPKSAITRVDGNDIPLTLREVAGAADALSRTWRVRYRINNTLPLRLGTLVSVKMPAPNAGQDVITLPLAAIDERGEGPQVWKIVDQTAQPFPVQLLSMDPREARLKSEHLQPGDHIIALGTHLLEPGMPVKDITP